jgi:opacity protein-like surface antigen
MKRIVISIILLGFTCITIAQINHQTIGLRIGDNDGLGTEISCQKALEGNNRLEVGLAWRSNSNYNAYKLSGTHQWIWDLSSDFKWYAGAGAGLGSLNLKDGKSGDDGFFLLANGVVGIEYAFDFPLLISLDCRPELGLANYDNDFGLDIALGIRYIFDK